MRPVTSNAVAQAFSNLSVSDSTTVGDRTNVNIRRNAVLSVLQNNPKVNNFSLRYTGGYCYGYITNNATSTQERFVLEINPYDAQIGIYYVNNTLTSITYQRTI